MAEIIGTVASLQGLGTASIKAIVSLYKLIQSFRHHPKHVRDLLQGIEELQGVLHPLSQTLSTDIGIDLSALEILLKRCVNACEEFEQEILKCSSRSGGDRTSFRDWAKLTYMGDDIDGFRRQLSGYQLAICVFLADANLRKSSLTSEKLEGYQRLLMAATDDLEAHLKNMDQKLQIIFERTVPETDEDATELRRIKEEYISTEKGLEICAQLSDHIEQIQVASKQSGNLPASEDLHECMENITQASSKLQAHMRDTIRRMVAKSTMSMTSKKEIADLAKLWEEMETSFQRKEMFSKAENRLNENISVIENYGTGDARQIMVSTDDKAIHGTNNGVGWRSVQIGGRMSEAALQDVVRTLSGLSDRRPDHDCSPPEGGTRTIAGDVAGNRRTEDFTDHYGPGFRLSPSPTLTKP